MAGKRSRTRYKVLLHAAVPKELRAIREPVRSRIKEAISLLASNPIPIGASRIKGRTNAYRIRVAAYRIVYEVHVTEIVVYVVRVGHRREVYRRILHRGYEPTTTG